MPDPGSAGGTWLSSTARALLTGWATSEGPLALRAQVVLLAADGLRDADISRRLGVSRQTVGGWRHRWQSCGLEGLAQRPRTGRPAKADESEVVTRTLLAPGGSGASRAVAGELGLSHATVSAIRRRWGLVPGPGAPPRVPAAPPLPATGVWVLGVHADPQRAVLLVGSRPGGRAAPGEAGIVGVEVLAGLDSALDDVRSATRTEPGRTGQDQYAPEPNDREPTGPEPTTSQQSAPEPAEPGPTADTLPGFLAEAADRQPGLVLHALTLWNTGPHPYQPPGSLPVTAHALPARSTWRGFLRAMIALDCTRHPESSRRVCLDLTAALRRGAERGGRVRWLRESIPGGGRPGEEASAQASGGVNQIDLGSFNERVVIEAVRLSGTITRGEIAHRTGLTQQSVSRISRTLLERGVLVEDAQRRATSGKPRTPVRLRGSAGHALGIHIDPEVLTAVVIDLDGAIICSRSQPVAADAAPEEFVDHVAGLGRHTLEQARGAVRADRFLGVGVAVPGPVDLDSGTVLAPPLMTAWDDTPLLYLLRERFPGRVVIEKDSTAAAAGERWIGRDLRARDFAYLYLGTGVGTGLYLNGDIYRGASANAGEFGQLCAVALGRFDEQGRPEKLPECNPPLSVPEEAVRRGLNLSGLARGGTAAYLRVAHAAAAGDPAATGAVRQVAAAVAQGALGLVDLLDIDLVVLGGPLFTDEVAGLYLDEISRVVNAYPTARRLRRVEVERAVLSAEAAAVGAASTIFHATFSPRLRGR